MKLLRSTKKDVDSDQNIENVPKLESVEVHCDLVKNDYQHTSTVLIRFVPNKQFGELINISLNFLLLKFGLQIKLVKHFKLKIIVI